MKSINKCLDAIIEEFNKPIPDHRPKEGSKMTPTKRKVVKAKKRVTATKKTPKVPKGPAEMITLTELAREIGLTDAVARQKLRRADIPREGTRWVWRNPSRVLNKVRKILEK